MYQQLLAALMTDVGAMTDDTEKTKGQPTQAAPLQSLVLDSCYFAGVAADNVYSPVHA